jgi:hypothetical protein
MRFIDIEFAQRMRSDVSCVPRETVPFIQKCHSSSADSQMPLDLPSRSQSGRSLSHSRANRFPSAGHISRLRNEVDDPSSATDRRTEPHVRHCDLKAIRLFRSDSYNQFAQPHFCSETALSCCARWRRSGDYGGRAAKQSSSVPPILPTYPSGGPCGGTSVEPR